ncbi:MAG: hypothetical protein J7518_02045 [Nocardioidaceae bacterium]|nr:hypothetical protein [Nocardioidaceae bacterium]
MSSPDLVEVADALYALTAAEFTSARDAAAKAAADKDLAKQIKALRKPSVAAWAVNLLVRRESEQIDQVLELAAGLRAAAESLDGEELRTLTKQRRQLTAALTTTARSLAREHDVKLTEATADQVEGMLTAAMLDPVAADVVRSGLVVTAFTSTGVSELDVPSVCAVPEALGHRASALAEPEPPGPPKLTVVSDEAVRRAEARERVHEATLTRAAAEEEAEQIAARIENLRARRLQLGGEIDELRRRLASLEDQVDEVDEDLDEAESAHDDALAEVADAVRELDAAEAALAAFD